MSSLFAKYLPTSVASMTFASSTLAKVANAMATGRLHDHLLLHGVPGCGKSLLATPIVSDRHPSMSVKQVCHEAAAGWDKGTETKILGQMNVEKMSGASQHYTVLNEVDKLSTGKQEALQAFMDTHLDMKFIMTSNYPQRLSPAFLNRSNPYLMEMTPAAAAVAVIQQTMVNFGYAISVPEALKWVAACDGSWRTLEGLVIEEIL